MDMAILDIRFDAPSTVDAIQILDGVRRDHTVDIPFVAWKILSRAQQRLERELDAYLRGGASEAEASSRIFDIRVDRPASGQ